jgi:hypothetical protein
MIILLITTLVVMIVVAVGAIEVAVAIINPFRMTLITEPTWSKTTTNRTTPFLLCGGILITDSASYSSIYKFMTESSYGAQDILVLKEIHRDADWSGATAERNNTKDDPPLRRMAIHHKEAGYKSEGCFFFAAVCSAVVCLFAAVVPKSDRDEAEPIPVNTYGHQGSGGHSRRLPSRSHWW